MPNFMLFLHQDQNQGAGRSRDEMLRVTKEYGAWAAKMRQEGRFVGGDKLTENVGKVLAMRGGKVAVTDGPYAETKEIVGGYFCIKAADFDEAVRLAQDCPHLKYGGRVEVRMVHEM